MATSWTAHYLDGRSATRLPVILHITPQALQIVIPTGEIKTWPYDHIRQTQGTYVGETARLECGDDPPETVVVSSASFLKHIHQVAPSLAGHFHNPTRREARVRWTIAAAVTVIILMAGLYRWGIPGVAAAVTPLVPVAWEESLGQQVVDRIAPIDQQCLDPERLEKLSQIVRKLGDTVPGAPYRIRLYVVDDPSINAFAAPGGHVLLLRGLLERTESPEQLAGVLAHELQHVYHRHTTRAILEQTAGTLLLTAVSGDFSGGMAWGLEGARAVGTLHYSRSHESEADVEGIKMMQAARLDSNAMIAFYGIMQRESKDHDGSFAFLETHPEMAQRIVTLLTLADTTSSRPSTLFSTDEWKDIRALCRIKQKSSVTTPS
ncbi:MAG: M48 family metallopeptidase [Nitrospiraceae bacterium]|nr:M48 family metallopeptidase [Nitrospiraceae bacterium]